MSDIESELGSCIAVFVGDLSGLVRQQALEGVRGALDGGSVSMPDRKPTAFRTVAKPVRTERPRGEKRSPEELAHLTEQLCAYVKGNSGQGMESIAKALNATTKELTLPLRKLLGDKKIVAKGQEARHALLSSLTARRLG
jgi:hypothetical protein